MRIISRKPLEAFKKKHADAGEGLDYWYQVMSKSTFINFMDIKKTFGNSVDVVAKGYVFDICNNKYRLAASIHFNAQAVFVREVMTHAEYSKETWKKRHQDFH